MALSRGIPGSTGTEPVVAPAAPAAPPPTQLTGRLVKERDGIYVEVGTLRARLDDASVAMLNASRPREASRSATADVPRMPDGFQAVIDAANRHRSELMAKPGVISVRAGYKFVGGKITRTPAVVVAVERKRSAIGEAERIPPALPNGVPTDVAIADPYERLAALAGTEAVALVKRPRLLIDEIQGAVDETELLEALPQISYEPPANGNLEPVSGAMTVVCHVSPDAGWRVLRPFLEATVDKLRLGMYDFTAPHIYRTVRSLLRDSQVSWHQTLDPKVALPGDDDPDSTKAEDLTEASVIRGLKRVAGGRFDSAFARVGSGLTFAHDYHIKVAVRDDTAFWLSSGNWQSSNQPDIDFLDVDADRQLIPRYNREWHVVIENPTLAKRFQVFLEHDFHTAKTGDEAAGLPQPALPDLLVPADEILTEERAAADLQVFPPQKFVFTSAQPLTVQPILTPDNYLDVVLKVLRKRPARRLYFQNQSLNPVKSPSPEFAELMRLLAEYSNDRNLDVRLIFRNIGPIRKKVESLQLAGFDMNRVRMQGGCHTKGIIIDSRVVLLGSHNVSNQGVQVNRDASLLIEHAGIAGYYERVFLHDWDKLARPTIREEAMPVPLLPGQEAAGMDEASVRLPWSYLEED